MAQEYTPVVPESLKNIPESVLRQALKVRSAEERMAELRKNLSSVKGEIAQANTVEDLYRVCAGFVSKVNNARQILGTSQKSKLGKKPSK